MRRHLQVPLIIMKFAQIFTATALLLAGSTACHAQSKSPKPNIVVILDLGLAEKKNVAKQHPEIIQRLKGILKEFEADLAANSRPCGVAKTARTLAPTPGVPENYAYKPTFEIKKLKLQKKKPQE